MLVTNEIRVTYRENDLQIQDLNLLSYLFHVHIIPRSMSNCDRPRDLPTEKLVRATTFESSDGASGRID